MVLCINNIALLSHYFVKTLSLSSAIIKGTLLAHINIALSAGNISFNGGNIRVVVCNILVIYLTVALAHAGWLRPHPTFSAARCAWMGRREALPVNNQNVAHNDSNATCSYYHAVCNDTNEN